MSQNLQQRSIKGIAIIGMAGRFPGAASIREYWRNLCAGVESITFATDEELLAAGVPRERFERPAYVRAGGVVKDADFFDASFFGLSARESEILDPQHRVFLECAWDAFENAGYDPLHFHGEVGVFAGAGMNTYGMANLYANNAVLEAAGGYQLMLGNDKDFLATRVAYKLNLRGPAVSIQTACSTSLVAVQAAFESLQRCECEMALAGGVSIYFPQNSGYQYMPGMILSPDGHCRAFDEKSAGTVPGRGAGAVLLKPLDAAILDRDYIYAVIKGAAINNDGAAKVGYSAPSVDGQRRVIEKSIKMAGFAPETIRYVEAHGTGTDLGDPIEVTALSEAFNSETGGKQYCALGSVKTNIGHLDAAAGVAGLIKASLALRHRLIPATLHYQRSNPLIPLKTSPFYVNDSLLNYNEPQPLRAGVSSFGIGGTNAHVSLEETPLPLSSEDPRPQLIVISARSESSLAARAVTLAQHLAEHPDESLSDVAWTLQQGRHPFRFRRAFVAPDTQTAREVLQDSESPCLRNGTTDAKDREVVFVFPGQGSQYPNMGRGLYESSLVFRQTMDECSEILKHHLGLDLRDILFPADGQEQTSEGRLAETWLTQPALFCVEYATAQLWLSCGLRPVAMLGHSVGEYVAACLAGVFRLEDALRLIALRGKLTNTMPAGAMLAVQISESRLVELLPEGVSIAAINAPSQTVASGAVDAIFQLEQSLISQGIKSTRLRTSHAFHSALLDPVVSEFVTAVDGTEKKKPSHPMLSNLSGTWLTDDEALDADYWGRHLRHAVRFADCSAVIAQHPQWIVLEAGPGNALGSLIRQQGDSRTGQMFIQSMAPQRSTQGDYEFWLNELARLWLAGTAIDWNAIHGPHLPRRVPLPGYPFERQRYWVDAVEASAQRPALTGQVPPKKQDISDWFYLPAWRRSSPFEPSPAPPVSEGNVWLLLCDEDSFHARWIMQELEKIAPVVRVTVAETFQELSQYHYSLSPSTREHWDQLLNALRDRRLWAERIVHALHLRDERDSNGFVSGLDRGFFSLMAIVQAIGNISSTRSVCIQVVTRGAFSVAGEPVEQAMEASLSGFVRMLPVESPNIDCNLIDVRLLEDDTSRACLVKELSGANRNEIVALRNLTRWTQTFEPVPLPLEHTSASVNLRDGAFVITGGLGGLGLVFAERLSRLGNAKIVLTTRSQFPAQDHWESLLASSATPAAQASILRSLMSLKAAGTDLHVMQADASDPVRMREVAEWCGQQPGGLRGIIHAAGVPSRSMLLAKTRNEAENVFQSKIQGTAWIEEALQTLPLDLVLLCSSISAIVPSPGLTDYATANAYLDAFAAKHDRAKSARVISVNWDAWAEVGMAAAIAAKSRAGENRQLTADHSLDHAISPVQGADVFEKLLTFPASQVVVSTRDLTFLIAYIHQQISSARSGGQESTPTQAVASHPRPDLSQAYVEPADDTERTVTEIWSELFGVEKIGRNDNFFELGGHSLLGTQAVARIRQRFGIDLPLRTVFEAPTPAELSNLLRTIPWASGSMSSSPMLDTEREEIEL